MRKTFLVVGIALLISGRVQAQARIDPSVNGKEVGGSYLLRLAPKSGEIFHYKISKKAQASAKSSDDLFKALMPDLKAEEKTRESTEYFITLSVRSVRKDGATDFLFHIDSTNMKADNNGAQHNFSSANPRDLEDSLFASEAIYDDKDIGAIIDPEGYIKDIYGYYPITDFFYNRLDDSLQTSGNENSLSQQVYSSIEALLRYIVSYLPEEQVAKDSATNYSNPEDLAVWRSLSFPMKKEYSRNVMRFEDQGGKIYGIINSDITYNPTDRILDEKEYKSTLPNFSYAVHYIEYIDKENGMLAYEKWTKDEVAGLKIESKLAEKEGKSFATVQRTKVEIVVELLK